MGMTEKQGGTDVRANTTRAEHGGRRRISPDRAQMVHVGAHVRRLPGAGAGAGRAVLLPACRASCPTAASTRCRFQRLKDKLGNRSNASSEVEFDGAIAWLIGEEGARRSDHHRDGDVTRLDCAVASAGADARWRLPNAIHHARHRSVFGKQLDRSAADAAGAGRHGARSRGGDRAVVPAGAQLRLGGDRPAREARVRPRS